MKITLDIDCTPEELRSFFGLPDVKPMQGRMLDLIEERMTANMAAMEPDALFKVWLPAGFQGLEQLQKMFWSRMSSAMARTETDEEGK